MCYLLHQRQFYSEDEICFTQTENPLSIFYCDLSRYEPMNIGNILPLGILAWHSNLQAAIFILPIACCHLAVHRLCIPILNMAMLYPLTSFSASHPKGFKRQESKHLPCQFGLESFPKTPGCFSMVLRAFPCIYVPSKAFKLGLCIPPVTTFNMAPRDSRFGTPRSECGIDTDVERNYSLRICIH